MEALCTKHNIYENIAHPNESIKFAGNQQLVKQGALDSINSVTPEVSHQRTSDNNPVQEWKEPHPPSVVCLFSQPGKSICLAAHLKGSRYKFPVCFDTGNLAFDLISFNLYNKLSRMTMQHPQSSTCLPLSMIASNKRAVLPNGAGLQVMGALAEPLILQFEGLDGTLACRPQVVKGSPIQLNLGLATMALNEITIQVSLKNKNRLMFKGQSALLCSQNKWTKMSSSSLQHCECQWCTEKDSGLPEDVLMQLHDEATSKVIDHPSQLDPKTRAPYLTPQLCRPVRGQTLNAGYMTLVEIQIHQALAHRPICFTPSPEPRLSQLSIPHALYQSLP